MPTRPMSMHEKLAREIFNSRTSTCTVVITLVSQVRRDLACVTKHHTFSGKASGTDTECKLSSNSLIRRTQPVGPPKGNTNPTSAIGGVVRTLRAELMIGDNTSRMAPLPDLDSLRIHSELMPDKDAQSGEYAIFRRPLPLREWPATGELRSQYEAHLVAC